MAENMKDGKFVHDCTVAPQETRVLPLFSLKGRTAIVSGAGAGIGLAVAQGFAEAGANVAIWYNSNKKAIEEAAAIEKTYGVKCRSRLLLNHAQDRCTDNPRSHNRQSLPSQHPDL